ncbi:MAG: cytochrome B [Planctomycetota bacterium]|nr:MAG: cytochrome B [Planctomycetota bacterium]
MPKRVLMYSAYERIWHWCQAAAILTLVVTGVAIHAPHYLPFVPMATAVWIHNALGLLLVLNAFLGLFYYVTTGTIRQFLPQPNDFLTLAAKQARYYLVGMFRGEPHPLEKTPEHRLNPLQQITYLSILNVLLPFQVVTGLLMWGAQYRPDSVTALGGLGTVAAIHLAGAWLFGAFLIAHVYLTTTGPTPTSYLKAMIFGYEEIDDETEATPAGTESAAT